MKKILIIFCASAFFIISFSFLYRKDNTSKENISTKPIEIFADSDGNPALAMGNCKENPDCSPSGCSSQICSDHNVTTTCELGDFPEKETYTCGCQNDRCVWYRYK